MGGVSVDQFKFTMSWSLLVQCIPTAIVFSFPVLTGAHDVESQQSAEGSWIKRHRVIIVYMFMIIVSIPIICLFLLMFIKAVRSFVKMDWVDKARASIPPLAGTSIVVILVGENQTWSTVLALVLSLLQVFGFLYWTGKRICDCELWFTLMFYFASYELFCLVYGRRLPENILAPFPYLIIGSQSVMHWFNIVTVAFCLSSNFYVKLAITTNMCIILLSCHSSMTSYSDYVISDGDTEGDLTKDVEEKKYEEERSVKNQESQNRFFVVEAHQLKEENLRKAITERDDASRDIQQEEEISSKTEDEDSRLQTKLDIPLKFNPLKNELPRKKTKLDIPLKFNPMKNELPRKIDHIRS